MVDIKMLRPGMKVKVVDQWPLACGFNHNRAMDKYLGQVVTVLEVNAVSVLIKEDEGEHPYSKGGHFRWNVRCLDHIVDGGMEATAPTSNLATLSFIFYD